MSGFLFRCFGGQTAPRGPSARDDTDVQPGAQPGHNPGRAVATVAPGASGSSRAAGSARGEALMAGSAALTATTTWATPSAASLDRQPIEPGSGRGTHVSGTSGQGTGVSQASSAGAGSARLLTGAVPRPTQQIQASQWGSSFVVRIPQRQGEDMDPKIWIPFREISLYKVIGKGSFKTVYRGSWNNTHVAVVAMRRGGLVAEARLLQRLSTHPNLVQLYRWSADDSGNEYLVMELLPLGSLDSVLRNIGRQLLTQTKMTVVEQLASACLELAHEGLVHGDLAARNLLVKSLEPPHVKLADFGLAKPAVPLAAVAASLGPCPEETCGTDMEASAYPAISAADAGYQQASEVGDSLVPARWAAPEVLAGDAASHAGDVWSWGVVCWEIFANGAEPYANLDTRQILSALRSGYRLERPRGCPLELWELVLGCWQADPRERPSFEHITATLRAWREAYVSSRMMGGGGGMAGMSAVAAMMGAATTGGAQDGGSSSAVRPTAVLPTASGGSGFTGIDTAAWLGAGHHTPTGAGGVAGDAAAARVLAMQATAILPVGRMVLPALEGTALAVASATHNGRSSRGAAPFPAGVTVPVSVAAHPGLGRGGSSGANHGVSGAAASAANLMSAMQTHMSFDITDTPIMPAYTDGSSILMTSEATSREQPYGSMTGTPGSASAGAAAAVALLVGSGSGAAPVGTVYARQLAVPSTAPPAEGMGPGSLMPGFGHSIHSALLRHHSSDGDAPTGASTGLQLQHRPRGIASSTHQVELRSIHGATMACPQGSGGSRQLANDLRGEGSHHSGSQSALQPIIVGPPIFTKSAGGRGSNDSNSGGSKGSGGSRGSGGTSTGRARGEPGRTSGPGQHTASCGVSLPGDGLAGVPEGHELAAEEQLHGEQAQPLPPPRPVGSTARPAAAASSSRGGGVCSSISPYVRIAELAAESTPAAAMFALTPGSRFTAARVLQAPSTAQLARQRPASLPPPSSLSSPSSPFTRLAAPLEVLHSEDLSLRGMVKVSPATLLSMQVGDIPGGNTGTSTRVPSTSSVAPSFGQHLFVGSETGGSTQELTLAAVIQEAHLPDYPPPVPMSAAGTATAAPTSAFVAGAAPASSSVDAGSAAGQAHHASCSMTAGATEQAAGSNSAASPVSRDSGGPVLAQQPHQLQMQRLSLVLPHVSQRRRRGSNGSSQGSSQRCGLLGQPSKASSGASSRGGAAGVGVGGGDGVKRLPSRLLGTAPAGFCGGAVNSPPASAHSARTAHSMHSTWSAGTMGRTGMGTAVLNRAMSRSRTPDGGASALSAALGMGGGVEQDVLDSLQSRGGDDTERLSVHFMAPAGRGTDHVSSQKHNVLLSEGAMLQSGMVSSDRDMLQTQHLVGVLEGSGSNNAADDSSLVLQPQDPSVGRTLLVCRGRASDELAGTFQSPPGSSEAPVSYSSIPVHQGARYALADHSWSLSQRSPAVPSAETAARTSQVQGSTVESSFDSSPDEVVVERAAIYTYLHQKQLQDLQQERDW